MAAAIFLLVGPLHVNTGLAVLLMVPLSLWLHRPRSGIVILDLARLTWTFLWLSLICVGGGLGVIPELQRQVVDRFHWVTAREFLDGYTLSQLTPGPTMLVSIFVGYRAHGVLGALLATVAMFLPTAIITVVITRHWATLRDRPWARASRAGAGAHRHRAHGGGRLHAGALGRPRLGDGLAGAADRRRPLRRMAASRSSRPRGRHRRLARRALSERMSAAARATTMQFRWYLGGHAAWFTSFGIQMIVFPWLVAVVLKEPAQRVGIAQMAVMTPAMLFMLLGGAVADRADCRRLLLRYQLLAVLPPLALAGVIAAGALGYHVLLVYGVAIGSLTAFVIPARDALLTRIVQHGPERAIAITSAGQFICQLVGIVVAGFAGRIGALGAARGPGRDPGRRRAGRLASRAGTARRGASSRREPARGDA